MTEQTPSRKGQTINAPINLEDLPRSAVIVRARLSCPKMPGSQAAWDWLLYRPGMTVASYLALESIPARRARANLLWDYARGFIRFEVDGETFTPVRGSRAGVQPKAAPEPTPAPTAPKTEPVLVEGLFGAYIEGGNAG